MNVDLILEKLDGLRAELADLAFLLECRGCPDAADVAIMTSARVEEFRAELEAAESDSGHFRWRASFP